MPLTDPELDLLREMLAEDPTDDVYLQVGEELVRRSLWAEAEEVLSAGLASDPDSEGFALLARAALECAHYDLALTALGKIDTDVGSSPAHAQLEILALERAGHVDRARKRIDAYLEVDPSDVVVTSALERLDLPPPDVAKSARDPFLSVERAERYVAVGRVDRAVRIYRRILFRHGDDPAVAQRLRQLAADPYPAADDLSEELTDPGVHPPDLTMPEPALGQTSEVLDPDEEITETGVLREHSVRAGERLDDADDETDIRDREGGTKSSGRRRRKRRRRSLLNR